MDADASFHAVADSLPCMSWRDIYIYVFFTYCVPVVTLATVHPTRRDTTPIAMDHGIITMATAPQRTHVPSVRNAGSRPHNQ